MHRIAIIDDSEINLTLLKALVAKLGGCEALLFQESCQGLQWCSDNLPDLVIVDYMMPKLDGLDFVQRLRQVSGRDQLPILMITANDNREVRYRALEIGATDFLTKPVDRMEFSARVRNMLALNSSRRHLADRAVWLAEEVTKATAAVHAREQELLYRMSRAAEFRDPETGAHIQRMAYFSRLIAADLQLNSEEQDLIFKAAPMHDIGKIGIPDSILLKPGRLSTEEYAVMKGHAKLGFDLLEGSESKVLQMGAQIAYSHHEKFDGTGYPRALVGSDIPLCGRIVAVADVFDALVSERPYKRAWSYERAFEFLKTGANNHFDGNCVEVFLKRRDEIHAIRARFQEHFSSEEL